MLCFLALALTTTRNSWYGVYKILDYEQEDITISFDEVSSIL